MYARINDTACYEGDRVQANGQSGTIVALYGDAGGLTAERVRVRWDDGEESGEDPDELETADEPSHRCCDWDPVAPHERMTR